MTKEYIEVMDRIEKLTGIGRDGMNMCEFLEAVADYIENKERYEDIFEKDGVKYYMENSANDICDDCLLIDSVKYKCAGIPCDNPAHEKIVVKVVDDNE